MILESFVVKWSVRKAGKAEYKAGRAFLEKGAGVPAVITDSLETSLDEMAPIESHIGLGSLDGNLVIVTIHKRDAFKENWARRWVANFRDGFRKALSEPTQPQRSLRE